MQTLDVLRGIALFAVLLGNLYMLYTWRWSLWGKEEASAIDTAAEWVMEIAVASKGQTLLTMLFGYGFAAQLLRAEGRGDAVLPIYLRRLAALFVIGWCHVLFLWWGDVTWGYAVAGVPLLAFMRASNRTRFWCAAAFLVIPAVIYAAVPSLWEDLYSRMFATSFADNTKALLAAAASGDRIDLMKAHATMAIVWISGSLASYPLWLLGRFLLGYIAGAARWFDRDGADHLPVFRRMVAFGGLAALPYLLVWVLDATHVFVVGAHGTPARIASVVLREIGWIAQTVMYIGIVVLLMQRAPWRRLLGILAPVGRMPLTTYIVQSVICTFLFYGWGLGWTTPSKAETVALAVPIFAAQIMLAHLWLRWFRFGPAEWLWRTVVYWRAQPMR